MRGRNVVVLKVVLGGMGLTGGHHPKREAGASLTSPTAPAPALSGLPLLLLLTVALLALLPPCLLAVLSSSSSPTDGLLATPTRPQVVPATQVGREDRRLIFESSEADRSESLIADLPKGASAPRRLAALLREGGSSVSQRVTRRSGVSADRLVV
ncbi:hypothetical protein KM043_012142 [Ampulex compressa]|nr:hypothetical protein KM043_012142 [Ampulex compressa]